MTQQDAQRTEIANAIAASLRRLARSRSYLTFEQRLELAEVCRDVGDYLDNGAGDSLRCDVARRRLSLL